MAHPSIYREKELQALNSPDSNQIRLRHYFKALLRGYNGETGPCLFLPSLMALSKTLDCSPLDLSSALVELKKQGYDHFTLGIYSPITLWHPSKIRLMPEE